jgi:hypothetical protein
MRLAIDLPYELGLMSLLIISVFLVIMAIYNKESTKLKNALKNALKNESGTSFDISYTFKFRWHSKRDHTNYTEKNRGFL